MDTNQEPQNRPAQPASAGEDKEPLGAVIGYSEGRTFVIPIEVAQPFESAAAPCAAATEEEVGGRHYTYMLRSYHSNWQNGPYIWITDGRAYRGPHWHPNPNSPFAYDMDNY